MMIEILTTYISIYTFITFIIISHYIVSHIYYYFVNIIFNDINQFEMINKILLGLFTSQLVKSNILYLFFPSEKKEKIN